MEQYHSYGIFALGHKIGDYNCIYNIILSLLSYIPLPDLYTIKIVSVIFDFVIAIFGYKITKEVTRNDNLSLITYTTLLFLPSTILNSGVWAQCDSIYTAFAVISIYFLIKEEYIKSFIFAGISFSFKLQFIFLLPVFVIYYVYKKRFSILNFLIIPFVNFIFAIPSILLGRGIIDVLLIYFNQANEYQDYTLNFPNLYKILGGTEHLKYLGIILCMSAFIIILYCVINKKIKLNSNNILLLCAISPIIAPFFLPHMHDRYLFMGDIYTVIWFICSKNKKYLYVPVTINLVSLSTYTSFLFGYEFLNPTFIAVIYLLVLIKFMYDIICQFNTGTKNSKSTKIFEKSNH